MVFVSSSGFQATVHVVYNEFDIEVSYKRVGLYRTTSYSEEIAQNHDVSYNRV